MAISTKLFRDTKEILNIEKVWNQDFAMHFKNPGLFSRMFCGVMNFCEFRGWTPLIVTFWSNNKLVGVAPLKSRKFLNTNYVQSLADDLYSDFFFFDEYREQCINLLFEIVFNRLKCMSAAVTLETTDNIRALKNNCPKGLKYVEQQGSGSAVIPIEKSYDEFYGSLKHKVRNAYRPVMKLEYSKWPITERERYNIADVWGKTAYNRRGGIEWHKASLYFLNSETEPGSGKTYFDIMDGAWKWFIWNLDGCTDLGGYKVPGTNWTGPTNAELRSWSRVGFNRGDAWLEYFPMEIFVLDEDDVLVEDKWLINWQHLGIIKQEWERYVE